MLNTPIRPFPPVWVRVLSASLAPAMFSSLARSEDPVVESPLLDIVSEHCITCHNPEKKKGKLDLESILDADMGKHRKIWEEVVWMLQEREMPPEDEPEPRPSESEYRAGAAWLEETLALLEPEARSSEAISSQLALVDDYCISCHNAEEEEGGMNLDAIRLDSVTAHPEIWEKVIRRLHARQMPPADRKRPSEETYQATVASLSEILDQAARENPNPGRVDTFRRLNRTEYQNAIRDLLALEIDAASLLPKDEESHGFDNITVGTLSPSLLDRYISAAQKVSRLAVGAPQDKLQGDTIRIPADQTQERHVAGLPLGTRGGTLLPYTFPQEGDYEVEVRLSRDRNEHVEGLNESHEMEVLLDRALVERFTIDLPEDKRNHNNVDAHLKTRFHVKAGPRELGVTFAAKPYSLLETKRQPFAAHFNHHRHPRLSPAVYQISITGPFNAQGASDTPSRRKIFTDYPETADEEQGSARVILSALMRKAYRRSISEWDLNQALAFYTEAAQENGFEMGIEAALASILVNPEFIFRIEREPRDSIPGQPYYISDTELATRLSFFLWSSLPDDELLDVAIAGDLRKPGMLEKQVRRMLADKRSYSLVENFAGQWLHLRNLASITPDLRLYPDFDDNLRQAFRKETELFFASILREDRSILDLLQADYTYLNERLARHYGISGVFGSRFRRVELDPEAKRGGLLRQGSILTVTSYATRTSPTIRGNWVLENVIGTPPPPPPPNIPALDENKVDASLSIRDRLEQHRANPACASCHDLMDPVGFALENYDAIGRWRDFENGAKVDASGGLPDGSAFVGVDDLEVGLLERPELFVRTFSEKLLTFAIGRGVETYDAPAIREILRKSKEDSYRFSSLVASIAQSVPFQMRNASINQYASTE